MSGGWTVVDSITNKSMPIQGTSVSGAIVPYTAPSPGSQDAVGKMRVSTPQALIDTDFEYGTQPTKWESIALQNNRQSVYYIPQSPIPITSIIGSGVSDGRMLFTSSSSAATNPLAVDDPIFIQNSNSPYANGWGLVISVGGSAGAWTAVVQSGGAITPGINVSSFNTIPASNQNNSTITAAYKGYFYSGCGFALSGTAAVTYSGNQIFVATAYPHGLSSGSLIYLKGLTGGSPAPNGAWQVTRIDSPTTFAFYVPAVYQPTLSITNTSGQVNLFARPAGYVEPRTFDGGVAFTAGGGIPNQQLIRQTRRYFRYQSGKSIQFSTGTSLKPALFATSMTSSGTTITVTTRFQHNLTTNSQIQVFNANQGQYNGIFTVSSVTSPSTFTYTAGSAPTVTTATGNYRVSPYVWYGSQNRVGMYDQQNGFFFEYDGQTLYAVLRNSINQINGTVVVTNGDATVNGTGTQFSSQLAPGDFIVIRGMTYRVLVIASDTSMTISPEYRGTTIASPASCVVSKTTEVRIPQSQWADRCDGTGPSGYNLDLTRMQMWFIDYSWYGAGVVRYGIRTSNGVINYVTQIQNNNRQFEAYMRSGNMAAHYESSGLNPVTTLTNNISGITNYGTQFGAIAQGAAVTATQTTIPYSELAYTQNIPAAPSVIQTGAGELIYYSGRTGTTSGNLTGCIRGYNGTTAYSYAVNTGQASNYVLSAFVLNNATGFPPTGTVKLQAAAAVVSTIEYVPYTFNRNNILWGLTRASFGGSSGGGSINYTFSSTTPLAVELASPDTTPSLSHWGSSVIMDGQFNDDKSLIFNYGTTSPLSFGATATVPVLAIRIAPSVSNGLVGVLGSQEIINRMQLQLVELGLITTQPCLINLVLNGLTSGGTWSAFASPTQGNTISSSLAQVAVNTNSAATISGGESVTALFSNGVNVLDLSGVRDLGNSILGGGTTNTVPTTIANYYPDGPDILYVVVTGTGTAGTILARLNWKEAQA